MSNENICITAMLDTEFLRSSYENTFSMKVSKLKDLRREKGISQLEMSRLIKRSERTIQNFEGYKCFDYYLIFCYRKILNC